MEERIKISILLTSFNYENYIKETIESVINQTYTNWELIIVDDGSTDNSVEVINSYCQKDKRIKLFQHEGGINNGLKASILLGLRHCQAEWIAFLESDDIFVENTLEEKIKTLKENPKADLIFSDVKMFGETDVISSFGDYFSETKKIIFNTQKTYLYKLLKRNIIPTFSVVMVKKEVLSKCNFESPIMAYLDYYLWLQIASDDNIIYIDKKLTRWRMHSNSYVGKVDYKNSHDRFIFDLKKANTIFKKTTSVSLKILCLISIIKTFRKWFLRMHISKNPSICFCGRYFIEKTKPQQKTN